MDESRLNELLHVALEAAAAASHVLLKHLEKQNDDLIIRAKRDGSLVSAADIASHQTIASILGPHGIPMICEEGELPSFSERSKWDWFWLIDPLDGTESYLRNRSGFAVNIALCNSEGPVIGVISDPLNKRLFWGTPHTGACSSKLESPQVATPLTTTPVKLPYRLVTSWNEPLQWEMLLPAGLRAVEFTAEAVSGALKFCQIATGEADVHARSGPYMEWDCAAGDGLLRSIGLPVRSRADNQPLIYNTRSLRVEGLWVSRL